MDVTACFDRHTFKNRSSDGRFGPAAQPAAGSPMNIRGTRGSFNNNHCRLASVRLGTPSFPNSLTMALFAVNSKAHNNKTPRRFPYNYRCWKYNLLTRERTKISPLERRCRLPARRRPPYITRCSQSMSWCVSCRSLARSLLSISLS